MAEYVGKMTVAGVSSQESGVRSQQSGVSSQKSVVHQVFKVRSGDR